MNMFKRAVKAGIAVKVLEAVRREAAKPHNQAKARELLKRVTSRTGGGRRTTRDR